MADYLTCTYDYIWSLLGKTLINLRDINVYNIKIINYTMSLEGELGNLKIGTLIELYTHTDESVAGYVVDLIGGKVILSQNNPYNRFNVVTRDNLFEGAKSYRLEGFTQYKILRMPSTADEKFVERLRQPSPKQKV